MGYGRVDGAMGRVGESAADDEQGVGDLAAMESGRQVAGVSFFARRPRGRRPGMGAEPAGRRGAAVEGEFAWAPESQRLALVVREKEEEPKKEGDKPKTAKPKRANVPGTAGQRCGL